MAWRYIVTVTLGVVGMCVSSQAAVFNMETQIGPEEATEGPAVTDTCDADASGAASAKVSEDGRQVRIFILSSATVAGSDCFQQLAQATAAASASGTIEAEGDESGPVTLCISGSASQDAFSSVDGYIAGSALVLLAEVESSPVYEFGPTSVTAPADDSETRRFEVQALIGDTISVGGTSEAIARGAPVAGSASASARGEVVISIGSCSGVMAPAASPKALVALAVALALLGALAASARTRA